MLAGNLILLKQDFPEPKFWASVDRLYATMNWLTSCVSLWISGSTLIIIIQSPTWPSSHLARSYHLETETEQGLVALWV